ncbi:MAG TPA: M23 family metallopeptidase [Dissulfurispiraceae bacterium]|nr:M23 family metallopeptidase [Dissulfurispiraceae bacterium]
MYKIKWFVKKMFTPVSIMMVPHDSKKTINVKVPSIGIVLSILLWMVGSIYVVSIAIDAFEYQRMKNSLDYYAAQFTEMKSTMVMLKQAEAQFKGLLSRGGKKEILENIGQNQVEADTGSIDMEALKEQMRKSAESVTAVQEFLKEQRDAYLSTPHGWPVGGRVTSPFGEREAPNGGGLQFHTGIDISAPKGTPVKATADGIVSFAGWNAGSGKLVVVEHGFGYSTAYAHNSSIEVKVGQRVKRSEIISYSGSTGNSTGPHVHYEVWQQGKAVNPKQYLEVASNVSEKK